MPDATGSAPVDRLPVVGLLVSGLQVEQFLSVPKCVNGAGEAISNAAVTIVQECCYNCPRVGGLKSGLRPCALIPVLLEILADEV